MNEADPEFHREYLHLMGRSRIATGSTDGTIKLWDAASGREMITLRGHDGIVRDLAFNPDGKQLISVGNDMTVRVWNSDLEGEVKQLTPQAERGMPVDLNLNGNNPIDRDSRRQQVNAQNMELPSAIVNRRGAIAVTRNFEFEDPATTSVQVFRTRWIHRWRDMNPGQHLYLEIPGASPLGNDRVVALGCGRRLIYLTVTRLRFAKPRPIGRHVSSYQLHWSPSLQVNHGWINFYTQGALHCDMPLGNSLTYLGRALTLCIWTRE